MPANVEEHYRRYVVSLVLASAVAASLFLVAAVCIYAAASRWAAARASRSWPGIEGFIIESRLPSNCTHCRPVIDYRYMVDGQSFVGNQLVAGPQDFYSAREAEAKVGKYTVGRKVTIFYDSANPSVSALEPGVLRGTAYLFSVVSLCILGSALFFGWRMYRYLRTCERPDAGPLKVQ